MGGLRKQQSKLPASRQAAPRHVQRAGLQATGRPYCIPRGYRPAAALPNMSSQDANGLACCMRPRVKPLLAGALWHICMYMQAGASREEGPVGRSTVRCHGPLATSAPPGGLITPLPVLPAPPITGRPCPRPPPPCRRRTVRPGTCRRRAGPASRPASSRHGCRYGAGAGAGPEAPPHQPTGREAAASCSRAAAPHTWGWLAHKGGALERCTCCCAATRPFLGQP